MPVGFRTPWTPAKGLNGDRWWKPGIAPSDNFRHRMCMASSGRAADEAMRSSLVGWSSLILIPGMLFVFGLIYAVSPRQILPSQSWANGTYINACCARLLLRNGKITTANRETNYVVSESKFGHQITVAAGIGVRHGAVEFGGNYVFVHFNRDSTALPAIGKPASLHVIGLDDSRDYVFERRG